MEEARNDLKTYNEGKWQGAIQIVSNRVAEQVFRRHECCMSHDQCEVFDRLLRVRRATGVAEPFGGWCSELSSIGTLFSAWFSFSSLDGQMRSSHKSQNMETIKAQTDRLAQIETDTQTETMTRR